MIVIQANKIKTSGLPVSEQVVVRTTYDTRLGETADEDVNFIYVYIGYAAFAKMAYDIDGLKAPSFKIDGVESFRISIPKSVNASGAGYLYFDNLLKNKIMDALGLVDTDINII